jgi:hypothetical protein
MKPLSGQDGAFLHLETPWLLHGLALLYGRSGLAGAIPPIANVVVSKVPSPQLPLCAAGARMCTYWPMSIVERGVGLNITVMSYAGTMGFGFTTARVAVPDARELTQALAEAFDELVVNSQPVTSSASKASAAKAPPRKPRPHVTKETRHV